MRNPVLDESPHLAIKERVQEEQDIRDTNTENRRRARIGVQPIKPPVRPHAERKDGLASVIYIYEVKIKNIGNKTFRALTLNYVFFELDTDKEVERRQFTNKQTLSPG